LGCSRGGRAPVLGCRLRNQQRHSVRRYFRREPFQADDDSKSRTGCNCDRDRRGFRTTVGRPQRLGHRERDADRDGVRIADVSITRS